MTKISIKTVHLMETEIFTKAICNTNENKPYLVSISKFFNFWQGDRCKQCEHKGIGQNER